VLISLLWVLILLMCLVLMMVIWLVLCVVCSWWVMVIMVCFLSIVDSDCFRCCVVWGLSRDVVLFSMSV